MHFGLAELRERDKHVRAEPASGRGPVTRGSQPSRPLALWGRPGWWKWGRRERADCGRVTSKEVSRTARSVPSGKPRSVKSEILFQKPKPAMRGAPPWECPVSGATLSPRARPLRSLHSPRESPTHRWSVGGPGQDPRRKAAAALGAESGRRGHLPRPWALPRAACARTVPRGHRWRRHSLTHVISAGTLDSAMAVGLG